MSLEAIRIQGAMEEAATQKVEKWMRGYSDLTGCYPVSLVCSLDSELYRDLYLRRAFYAAGVEITVTSKA